MMTLGERLKAWRAEKNIGQKEASTIFGIPFRTYQNYEMDHSPPGAESMKSFIRAGINANWLLTGEGDMLLSGPISSAPSGKNADRSLKERQDEQHRQKEGRGTGQAEDSIMPDFALVPFFDIEASAGNGSQVNHELQTSEMAFRRDWLSSKGLQADKCALIKARGDSMETTIHAGDLLLVDTRIHSIKDDAIYIIESENHLVVKRIQQSLDGSVTIISDNQRYKTQIIEPSRAKELKIVGRVRWYGHEI
jgi:phage repressor protein C with HTH and peptisase S24 domain